VNVSKAVFDNVPTALADLAAERLALVRRLVTLNQEMAVLQTLLDITPSADPSTPEGG
jgi:hypothetical protein